VEREPSQISALVASRSEDRTDSVGTANPYAVFWFVFELSSFDLQAVATLATQLKAPIANKAITTTEIRV